MPDLTSQRSDDQTLVRIKLGPAGKTPVYATPGSAGCDLFCAEEICLWPGETRLAALDLILALEPGVEAQIRPRSGLSLRTELRVPNSPGTIDSDYRNPVSVLLSNTFSMSEFITLCQREPGRLASQLRAFHAVRRRELAASHDLELLEQMGRADEVIWLDEQGNPLGTLVLHPGDRIAQMVFARPLVAQFVAHPAPETIGSQRSGGFGSTGSR